MIDIEVGDLAYIKFDSDEGNSASVSGFYLVHSIDKNVLSRPVNLSDVFGLLPNEDERFQLDDYDDCCNFDEVVYVADKQNKLVKLIS